jgi:hypothetical protein
MTTPATTTPTVTGFPHQAHQREGMGQSAHFGHRDHSDRSIVITKIGGS